MDSSVRCDAFFLFIIFIVDVFYFLSIYYYYFSMIFIFLVNASHSPLRRSFSFLFLRTAKAGGAFRIFLAETVLFADSSSAD
jgi:hypothetical protein